MKNKKEGFTLIELLAVIVILAIILLIAVPILLNVIEKSRVGVFKISSSNIVRSAEYAYMREMYNNNDTKRLEFYYEEKIETSNKEGVKLNYKGEKPDSGVVLVNGKGKVSLTLYNSKYKLCAYKEYNEGEVKVERNITKENCDKNISVPKIELIGENPLLLEIILEEIYTLENDYMAYTSEGEITDNVEIYVDSVLGNIIDRSILDKEYEVIYKVIDGDLFKEAKRKVKIVDTTPPVIEVPENISLKVSEVLDYNLREGIIVTDNSGEELDFEVIGSLVRVPGSQIIKYITEDSSGNKTEVTRVIDVIDDEAPVITIIGNNPLSINVGSAYAELGATAIDEVDGDLTSSIITTGTVIISTPGMYYISYKVSDNEGNEAVATREVRVIDNIPPVITLNGSNPMNINIGSSYSEPGATATDNVDGNITSNIEISGVVNTSIKGTYQRIYKVKDSSGNETVITRTINVQDTTPPVVTFTPNGNTTYAKSHSVRINVTDTHGTVASRYYTWSLNTPSESVIKTPFSNGATINLNNDTGKFYVWVLTYDDSGNKTIAKSNVFHLDNESPSLVSVRLNATNIVHNAFKLVRTNSASDNGGGLASNPYKYQISTNQSTWTTECTTSSTSCDVKNVKEGTRYYYRICAVDVVGNESCTASSHSSSVVPFYPYD